MLSFSPCTKKIRILHQNILRKIRDPLFPNLEPTLLVKAVKKEIYEVKIIRR